MFCYRIFQAIHMDLSDGCRSFWEECNRYQEGVTLPTKCEFSFKLILKYTHIASIHINLHTYFSDLFSCLKLSVSFLLLTMPAHLKEKK